MDKSESKRLATQNPLEFAESQALEITELRRKLFKAEAERGVMIESYDAAMRQVAERDALLIAIRSDVKDAMRVLNSMGVYSPKGIQTISQALSKTSGTEALEKLLAAEREKCAKVCEQQDGTHDHIYAEAIRGIK